MWHRQPSPSLGPDHCCGAGNPSCQPGEREPQASEISFASSVFHTLDSITVVSLCAVERQPNFRKPIECSGSQCPTGPIRKKNHHAAISMLQDCTAGAWVGPYSRVAVTWLVSGACRAACWRPGADIAPAARRHDKAQPEWVAPSQGPRIWAADWVRSCGSAPPALHGGLGVVKGIEGYECKRAGRTLSLSAH